MCTDVSDHVVSTQRRAAVGKGSCLMTAQDRLLLRIRRGKEEAFNELVTQQHHLLIRIAMRYVASRDVAEEVVQDTWMAVFSSIDRFEGRSSLRAWICGILIHKAKDRGVREQRSRPFSDFEFDDDRSDDAMAHPVPAGTEISPDTGHSPGSSGTTGHRRNSCCQNKPWIVCNMRLMPCRSISRQS